MVYAAWVVLDSVSPCGRAPDHIRGHVPGGLDPPSSIRIACFRATRRVRGYLTNKLIQRVLTSPLIPSEWAE